MPQTKSDKETNSPPATAERFPLTAFLKDTLETLPGFQHLLKKVLPTLIPQKRPPGRPRIHEKPDPNAPKRPPGRPRTRPVIPAEQKRPPGRPRIHPKPDPNAPKRPPGRPRIHPKPGEKPPSVLQGETPKKPETLPDPPAVLQTEIPQTEEPAHKEDTIWTSIPEDSSNEEQIPRWIWEESPKSIPTDPNPEWAFWNPEVDPWDQKTPEEPEGKDDIFLNEMEVDQIAHFLFDNPPPPPEIIEDPEENIRKPKGDQESEEEAQETQKSRAKTSSECIDIYYREIRTNAPLTLEQEVELGTKYKKEGCILSFNTMVEANLKLVVHIAKRFRGMLKLFSSSMSFSDLVSEGNIGLLKAIERYDPERGNKISTYASWWITQQIQAALQKQGKLIRIPNHLLQKMRKIQRILDEYQRSNQVKVALDEVLPPDLAEIFEGSGIKASDVAALKGLLNISSPSLSLDDPELMGQNHGDNSSTQCLHETIEDKNATSPYEAMVTLTEASHLDEMLAEITPKERDILEARFGIKTKEPKTLEQVGEEFGITRERVRQIQEKALKKLRTKLLEKKRFDEINRDRAKQ